MAARQGAEVVVSGLGKTYGERIVAVRDVSFTLAPGEFALLGGPSGSGKTTLLNLLAGLDRPDSGEVVVDGEVVAAMADSARYRRDVIGFVFQLHHLIAGLTSLENVEIPLIPTVSSRAERMRRARAALAEVGLDGRDDHLPAQLSGGERQRVAIARALVRGPRLLLADEPTGALDSEAGDQVLALLGQLGRLHGMTVLLVSHDPRAVEHADHVLVMHDGRLTSDRQAVTRAPRTAAPA